MAMYPRIFLTLGLCFSLFAQQDYNITKYVLDNGFTILVKQTESTQRVAVQLWLPVGSKHETMHEKGIAHLIEHMIFKGTKNLSETDYKLLVNRLAANCNAVTSYDTTRYFFNVPATSWHEVLPLMADCLVNCTFKQELLNSELKAVIQELKMYRDNFSRELIINMISSIFQDHPYFFPVVGFKHHLWDKTSQDLQDFYKKHYVVQNAVLVVVGNVQAQDVIAQARECFGSLAKNAQYKTQKFSHSLEAAGTHFTLYRPITLPQVILGWNIPGLIEKPGRYEISVLSFALTYGTNARLYKLLVDEKKLVRSISSTPLEFFDGALFIISYEPFLESSIDEINDLIKKELDVIKKQGLSHAEIERINEMYATYMQDREEDHELLADMIAESYLTTGDPCFIFNDVLKNEEVINDRVKQLLNQFFKVNRMHQGKILPLNTYDLADWQESQQEIDIHDHHMLNQKVRDSQVEPPCLKHEAQSVVYKDTYFIIPKKETLKNGLELLWHQRTQNKKISLVMQLRADYTYDSNELPGLYKVLSLSFMEGSVKYPKDKLAHILQNHGITFSMVPGKISMNIPMQHIEIALDILQDLLLHPLFPADKLDLIKKQSLQDIKHFWDNESAIAQDLAQTYIFGDHHPKAKKPVGQIESIEKITREHVMDFYKKYISPHGTQIALVGNLETIDVPKLVQKYLGNWQGNSVEQIQYPTITPKVPETVSYHLNRDQVKLLFIGNSVDCHHEDYYKLLLFDYIFSRGMNSRLFNVRERTGIFYTISGSLVYLADEQPGMIRISTIVSKDRLQEAKRIISECIAHGADSITEQELIQAKNMAYFDLLDQYSTNYSIAHSFLYCAKINNDAYFKNYCAILEKITVHDIVQAVKKLLVIDNLSIVQVGRID